MKIPRPGTLYPILLLTLSLALLCGCGDDDPASPPPAETEYATLVYRLDDSANDSYTAADGLAWYGPFIFDADTGIAAADPACTGPFPMLHDDGPVATGGHEPEGETAGDGVWTAVVMVASPQNDWVFEHYPIRGSVDGSDGTMLFPGAGRTCTVAAGATGTMTVPGPAFVPMAATAIVHFSIDDTAGQHCQAGDGLAWKGSFGFDPATRVLTWDGSWQGPYVMLHDDGPWTGGGHEPVGSIAGDHVWSVAVWTANDAQRNFEYGAISGSVAGSDGTWIWSGSNGVFTVAAGTMGPIEAPGLVIPETW